MRDETQHRDGHTGHFMFCVTINADGVLYLKAGFGKSGGVAIERLRVDEVG